MVRFTNTGFAVGMALGMTAGAAVGQAPNAGKYSEPKYELHERRGVMVPMRDAVRLSVDIYAPNAPGKLPAILSLTPYDNNGLQSDARWYAKRGYVVVAADARGRYDSEGTFDPFDPKHKTDGYDLVEWMAKQPWSNGKVGMIGGSYGGWTQWWTASAVPPHLAAIAPQVAPPDELENAPYQNGVLVGAWAFDWVAMMSGRTLQVVDTGSYGGWTDHHQDLQHTPYSDINAFRGMESAPWFKSWWSQNKSTDPYWKAIAYQGEGNYSRMTVPSLAFSGWFDANHPGTPMNYLGMKRWGKTPEARRPTIIIGPWVHGINERVVGGIDYGPTATIDVNGYTARWFDHFLKGLNNGVERDPPVYLFVMGANEWRAERDWPLPDAKPTKYYFGSGGRANSLSGDGVLTPAPPNAETVDTYTYDPRKPTRDPFEGYPHHNGHIDGALDTKGSASGADVLVYQTAPLESPVEVIGPIEATLYAATSARDTDWFIRLVDVRPDGRGFLLTEGVMRARNRDPANEGRFNSTALTTLEPGAVYRYTIKFWRGTANRFLTGHRIRVEISSSWYPYFLPNLNTGADNLATVSISQAVVARQTIHHGPRNPSHLVLPIVPLRPPQGR
jgi:putative CocE/NonD family hydrolase